MRGEKVRSGDEGEGDCDVSGGLKKREGRTWCNRKDFGWKFVRREDESVGDGGPISSPRSSTVSSERVVYRSGPERTIYRFRVRYLSLPGLKVMVGVVNDRPTGTQVKKW